MVEVLNDSASKKYQLNQLDMKSIGFGALDACAGAVITYVLALLPQIEMGAWTPVIMFAATTAAKTVRKWISEQAIPDEDKKK